MILILKKICQVRPNSIVPINVMPQGLNEIFF